VRKPLRDEKPAACSRAAPRLSAAAMRGEGDEPRLTAQTLAERLGERLPGDDDLF